MDNSQQKQEGQKQNTAGNILGGINNAIGFSRRGLGKKIAIGAGRATVGAFAHPLVWIILGLILFLLGSVFFIVGFAPSAPGSPAQPEQTSVFPETTTLPVSNAPTPSLAPSETP